MSSNQKNAEGKPRTWSLELVIVIALPTLAVVGGIITMVIAANTGFQADSEGATDRFAREKQVSESTP